MQDIQDKLKSASKIASMLSYITPLMEPQKVRVLVNYLGDFVDSLVLILLEPHFRLLEEKKDSPGLRALQESLSLLNPANSLFDHKSKCVSSEKCEQLFNVKPEVEDIILNTIFDEASISIATKTLLNGCSNPETYIRLHAVHTLPYDLTFLPRRAISRALVILRAGEQILPNADSLHIYLAQILCQAFVKLCRFEDCLQEIDRFFHNNKQLNFEAYTYLQIYKGIALEGIGEISKARDIFEQVGKDALIKLGEDSSSLCFALSEYYRLGLATGDMTNLPITGAHMTQYLEKNKQSHIWCTALSFIAIMQNQLGKKDTALENSKVAIESAHSLRLLDIEVDVCNRRATLLFMQNRKKEMIDQLMENLPLLDLSGHALAATETKALIYQTTSYEDPELPKILQKDWQDKLPLSNQLPAINGIHIITGQAIQSAMINGSEGAKLLINSIRICEQIRKTIPKEQLHRFIYNFLETFKLFLYLPTHKFMPSDEYTKILRVLIDLFEFIKVETDLQLARALLQIHYSKTLHKPVGNDLINELILETILDPDNSVVHVKLAYEYMKANDLLKAKESCEHALQIDGTEATAHSLLGLLAIRSVKWQDAVQHYMRAIKCRPDIISKIYLEYAESLAKSGQPQAAMDILKPYDKDTNTNPLVFFLLAFCYSRLGDTQKEIQYLLRFVKESDDKSLIVTAKKRLNTLGQLHILEEIDRNQTLINSQHKAEQLSIESTNNKVGPFSNPNNYRSCSKCGRSVYNVDSADLIDNGLALISGKICTNCNSFFCIYPCSLSGENLSMRLCPACRNILVGVF